MNLLNLIKNIKGKRNFNKYYSHRKLIFDIVYRRFFSIK